MQWTVFVFLLFRNKYAACNLYDDITEDDLTVLWSYVRSVFVMSLCLLLNEMSPVVK